MGGHYRGLNSKRGPSNSPPPVPLAPREKFFFFNYLLKRRTYIFLIGYGKRHVQKMVYSVREEIKKTSKTSSIYENSETMIINYYKRRSIR
jgi:hypothetical protein